MACPLGWPFDSGPLRGQESPLALSVAARSAAESKGERWHA